MSVYIQFSVVIFDNLKVSSIVVVGIFVEGLLQLFFYVYFENCLNFYLTLIKSATWFIAVFLDFIWQPFVRFRAQMQRDVADFTALQQGSYHRPSPWPLPWHAAHNFCWVLEMGSVFTLGPVSCPDVCLIQFSEIATKWRKIFFYVLW